MNPVTWMRETFYSIVFSKLFLGHEQAEQSKVSQRKAGANVVESGDMSELRSGKIERWIR